MTTMMNDPHKVVIVEDVKLTRDYLADLVTRCLPNTQITKFDHPQKALAYFEKDDCDLLFLDMQMPEMSGLQLLSKIRNMGKNPYTVFVSAPHNAAKVREDFVAKPLSEGKIHEALTKYLQTKG